MRAVIAVYDTRSLLACLTACSRGRLELDGIHRLCADAKREAKQANKMENVFHIFWLFGCLVCLFVGWLVVWLVGGLVGGLVGLLVGWFVSWSRIVVRTN